MTPREAMACAMRAPLVELARVLPMRVCAPGPGTCIRHPVGRPISDAHDPCVELCVSKEGLLALVCTAQGW